MSCIKDARLIWVNYFEMDTKEIHIPYISFLAKCADIPELFNEVVSLSSNGTMTVATFDCLPEYYLSGEPELSCQGDGTWNHEEPTCCKSEE